MGVEGAVCVVTGGSGLTGRRLVEMLAERGAGRVVSFDISPKPSDAVEHPAVEYQQVRYSASQARCALASAYGRAAVAFSRVLITVS